MAVKELIQVWDNNEIIKTNIDFLRKPTKPVTFPISPFIDNIITDLIDTFKAVPCAGIAANQIGYNRKIFIGMKHDDDLSVKDDPSKNIDEVEPDPENYEIYINPQVISTDENSTQKGDEGCLSIPNITLELIRYDKIKVKYYNIDGKAMPKPPSPLKGFISRLFQHELDHLEGRLMLEHKNIANAGIFFNDNTIEKDQFELLLKNLFKELQ